MPITGGISHIQGQTKYSTYKLKGQGNADKNERKLIQDTHQPVSHLQEGDPVKNVGHSVCFQAG